jgi:hypothetical protein
MNDVLKLMKRKTNQTYGHNTKYFVYGGGGELMMENSSLKNE